MSPRIIARRGGITEADLRSCRGVLDVKLDSLLRELATNDREWAIAKRNPRKYVTDHGGHLDQYPDFRLEELTSIPNATLPVAFKPCPKGQQLVLKKVRDCTCYRWAEGMVRVNMLPGFPRSLFAKVPKPILIRFKACLKCREVIHWEWSCERVFHIFPILPIDRPKTKLPKVPKPR